jgi:release factor glutamine methyltransferase
MTLLTLKEAIAASARRLEGADAGRDAQLLLLHTLGLARTVLFTEPDRRLSAGEQAIYDAAVARRAAGEPVQYITGQQEFYGLMLKVSPAVLIPRPETELLVEAVLERLPGDRELKIVDVGTGSGAIAISVAHKLPMARVTSVDLSEAALAVAKENAAAHGVIERVSFCKSDLLEAVAGEKFDAVVSNPPYVPEVDRESLDRQVREYEPGMALFAGADGLDIYKGLVPQAWAALRPSGLLAMEIGYGQREAIGGLLDGWDEVEFLDDLQGIPRVALARRTK